MRRRPSQSAGRRGFTLVELLVAMALIIFIMAIISQAFVASTKTFRDLKAAGDMAERLRTATAVLKRYLLADHFEAKKRLSDPLFWAAGPPQEGFLRVYQGTPSAGGGTSKNVSEGTDPDANQPSFRVVDAALQFTVKLRGNTRGDFFVAGVPLASPILALGNPDGRYQDSGAVYSSQWAEVAFFLGQAINPTTGTQDTANGTPLYTLYMRQRLAVPDNSAGLQTVIPLTPPATNPNLWDYCEISGILQTAAGPVNTFVCNTPRDLTQPCRRFAMNPNVNGGAVATTQQYAGIFNGTGYTTFAQEIPSTSTTVTPQQYWGADVLLTDVISFDVRLLPANGPVPPASNDFFLDVYDLAKNFGAAGASSNPYYTAAGPMVFDTWSSTQDNLNDYSGWATAANYNSMPIWNGTGPIIKAVQIILRVWESKTEQTRQVTLVVPL
jgi:prepilin-type N-terminal cleavage/methylation domain-containing protein